MVMRTTVTTFFNDFLFNFNLKSSHGQIKSILNYVFAESDEIEMCYYL